MIARLRLPRRLSWFKGWRPCRRCGNWIMPARGCKRRMYPSFWNWKKPVFLCDSCWSLRPDNYKHIVKDEHLDGGTHRLRDTYYERCSWSEVRIDGIQGCAFFGGRIDHCTVAYPNEWQGEVIVVTNNFFMEGFSLARTIGGCSE